MGYGTTGGDEAVAREQRPRAGHGGAPPPGLPPVAGCVRTRRRDERAQVLTPHRLPDRVAGHRAERAGGACSRR
ncbi:hypothetical protein, partial [Actinoalloteichus spitiensis]|uniref:hypothetical protein n=1 Tax=Actinoalloteichus spitiensis TaxID=252394 RepID=UPI0004746CFF